MRRRMRTFVLAAGVLSSMLMIGGCATHVAVGYRYYDPYYSDYHVWNDNEVVYYNQWVAETHRPRGDFRRLRRRDQEEYWRWRHSHRDRR